MDNELLKICNLCGGYLAANVLHGINLSVMPGEVVTIIGANGAGKSSILRALSGVIPHSAGEIYFAGSRLDRVCAHDRIRHGLVHVPEGRGIFSKLTVHENLCLGAFCRSNSKQCSQTEEMCYQLFPILKSRTKQIAGTLSGGEQQMLAIARGLMGDPKLLALDEPSMGVAPILIEKIYETLAHLNKQGTTILLVEQNAALAFSLASRVHVIETGKIVLSGTPKELEQNPLVTEAYLGHTNL